MAEQKIGYYSPHFGCDPEIFFEKDGQIIGAEKVIPNGLTGHMPPSIYGGVGPGQAFKGFVLDGVQAELNPAPSHCRANLGNEIAASFRALRKHLAEMEGVSASFTAVVEVDPKELQSLSDKARILGCAPSNNAYDSKAEIKVQRGFRGRSAGGHIHLGLSAYPFIKDQPLRLTTLMDVIVGNTCVMIDRDPKAAERRKVYGRAGEFRTPPHGLEYRTLSNFWLRSYQLFSLVMGLSRCAVSVLGTTLQPKHVGSTDLYYFTPKPSWDAEGTLLKEVDLEKVQRAINTNDLGLAKENWKAVRAFLQKYTPIDYGFSLEPLRLGAFDFFLKQIEEQGIESWFPTDPLTHWCTLKEGHGIGWESFLYGAVTTKMATAPKVVQVA